MDEITVPMPGTCHPYYEDHARIVRKFLDRPAVVVPTGRGDRGGLMNTVTLEVKRCYGPAPFVGDPRTTDAHYLWSVAIDKVGAFVAGDAHLEFHPPSHP